MRTINASDFKAKCLALLDAVAETGEPITILKRGKPVAELVPPVRTDQRHPQETIMGTVEILGDVVAPAQPEEAWEVLATPDESEPRPEATRPQSAKE